mmetsp:Transcript_11537/g.26797  ORF Transcript_11537/g.26797 Transcript_11537/m.26797 type:complete len:587 (-) Transcript_11537:83-1843(-)
MDRCLPRSPIHLGGSPRSEESSEAKNLLQALVATPTPCQENQPPQQQRQGWRELLRRVVTSAAWAAVIFGAVASDLVLFSVVRLSHCQDSACQDLLHQDFILSVFVVAIYTIDVGVKMLIFTPYVYLQKWGNAMDFFVTVISVIFLGLQRLGMEAGAAALRAPRALAMLSWLASMGHCGRSCLFIRMLFSHCELGARHIVGKNKRRYINLEQDFDLDLAYVEKNVIAMSVPGYGVSVLYRNPLPEVVRFMEMFHACNYLIINCCPELKYPHDAFKTGVVELFDIQDHTPPKMNQFVRFLNMALEWMTEDSRVMAVHCKGGKGRTGSLCCAWMLYKKIVADAQAACERFAEGRTDMFYRDCGFRQIKLQTVDTPSQVRYLRHLQAMLAEQKAYWPAKLVDPPCKALQPLVLTIHRFFKLPPDGFLIAAVHDGASSGEGEHRVVAWSAKFKVDSTGSARVQLNAPLVRGDARITIFDAEPLQRARAANQFGLAFPGDLRSDWGDKPWTDAGDLSARRQRRVRAGKEPGCLFYFMFHTTYVGLEGPPSRDSSNICRLDVPRADMDRASKGKRKRLYREDGLVTLEYCFA